MIKDKELHLRLTPQLFKKIAITAIENDLTRNQLVEQAVEHYINYLNEFTFDKK
jgi:predicted HicB family RNase H-like nuclease